MRLRQTSPAEGLEGPGPERPRRRSLGHGPNLLDSSDDEQMKAGDPVVGRERRLGVRWISGQKGSQQSRDDG